MVAVRTGLTTGALTTVDGVVEGAVAIVEVTLGADLFVVNKEEVTGAEKVVNVAGAFVSLIAAGAGVDILMLVFSSVVGFESELSLTD